MKNMNRRTTLTALCAAPAASLPALAATTTDPHRAWLEQWRHAKVMWESQPEDTPEAYQWEVRFDELEMKLMTNRAETPDGIAAQIEFAIENNVVGQEYAGGNYGIDRVMFERIAETLRA
ncbi:hypothetical protein [Ruegeria sp. HKCCD8929]|uniref:hypothetical protein n=1 Tax=Ruegeria sp. HKCCD8929 TaxID=2683006 RepID=UPI001487B7E7|nr:hypothetical protein [Ruegeria sp. HKCCD8929]